MLENMLAMLKHFPNYQFVIAGAPSQEDEFYMQFIKNTNVVLVKNETYNLLSLAHAALVTSGTATLETALFNVPEVVCYKGNFISYHIAKQIVQLKFISLVNLIMDREVVTELIQNDFNKKRLKSELDLILTYKNRERLLEDYQLLKKRLGGVGASQRTAELIYKATQENN
jgi:lipid-A-disaccharide synthase